MTPIHPTIIAEAVETFMTVDLMSREDAEAEASKMTAREDRPGDDLYLSELEVVGAAPFDEAGRKQRTRAARRVSAAHARRRPALVCLMRPRRPMARRRGAGRPAGVRCRRSATARDDGEPHEAPRGAA